MGEEGSLKKHFVDMQQCLQEEAPIAGPRRSMHLPHGNYHMCKVTTVALPVASGSPLASDRKDLRKVLDSAMTASYGQDRGGGSSSMSVPYFLPYPSMSYLEMTLQAW